MADANYEVKVTTTGDAKGAQEVGTSLDKLTEAAAKNNRATREQGEETKRSTTLLEQLGSRGGEARDVIEGLESASRGGTVGLLGMAKAARALSEGFNIGIWTVVAGVFIALIPRAAELIGKFTGLAQSEKEVALRAEIASQRLNDMVENTRRVAELRLDGLKDSLAEVNTAAEETIAGLAQIQQAADKLDDVEKAAALADNAANPGLTEQQRAERDLAIRRDFAERKRIRQEKNLEAQVEIARSVRDQTQQVESAAADRLQRQQGITAGLEAKESLGKRGLFISEQLSEAFKQRAAVASGALMRGNPGDIMMMGTLTARIEKLSEELKPLRPFVDLIGTDQFKATLEGNRADLAGRTKEFEEANRFALEAAKKLEAVIRSTSVERAVLELSREPQRRAEDAAQIKAVDEARQKDEPQAAQRAMEQLIRQFVDAGAARLSKSFDLGAGNQRLRDQFFQIQSTGDFGRRERTPEELAQVAQLMSEIVAQQNTYRDESARVFGEMAAALREMLQSQQSTAAALQALEAQLKAQRR